MQALERGAIGELLLAIILEEPEEMTGEAWIGSFLDTFLDIGLEF